MYNPLNKKGTQIEKQFRDWNTLNSQPYDKDTVHPYARTEGILMNGIEVEAAFFLHNFARHTADMDLRRKLAMIRRAEQQQQKCINWLIPADETNLEVTIGYEQVAVDLTAFLAQKEKNPYVKQALDFALLEDFDHLYRYSNLLKLTTGKDATDITKEYTEIIPGRPTSSEHRYPEDDVRNPTDKKTADPMSNLHIMTIVAGEQQTMNYYMNTGNRFDDKLSRGLYLEIAQIEEQHVTHYESLLDPRTSWFEQWLLHEMNECWLYYSLIKNGHNKQTQKIWEEHLDMELEHLRMAGEAVVKYEKKDPAEFFPQGFSHLFEFKSNLEYVRDILETQLDFGAIGSDFVFGSDIPKDYRYFKYQKTVNEGGAPSDEVISQVIKKEGKDYRSEILSHAHAR